MNIKEIVKKYLKDNGFDGLAGDNCGCGLDDLMPCEEPSIDCVLAKHIKCEGCPNNDGNCDIQPLAKSGCYVVAEVKK
jgi:hypothetical protein